MTPDHEAAMKWAQAVMDTDYSMGGHPDTRLANLARAYLELRAHQKGCVERWRRRAELARTIEEAGVGAVAADSCADELEAILSRDTGAVVWPRDYWPDDLRLARDRLLSSDQFAPDWERLVAFRDACLNHTHPAPAQDEARVTEWTDEQVAAAETARIRTMNDNGPSESRGERAMRAALNAALAVGRDEK